MTNPYVTPTELKGLPPEIIKQLHLNDSDKKDLNLIEIIEQFGPVGIDKILVQYYLKHGEILDRQKLMTRLYRMKLKGLVKTVGGRKGIYEVNDD